ncbi:MAG: NAD(P)/FAD-dependent oxidoreductase [Candidatus Aenigmatarchaeota archaeon]
MSNVIIIGGGPAGCSAGVTIKRLMPELEVELFEQRPKIGKVECGEAISKKAVEENSRILSNFLNKCIKRDVKEFKIIVNEGLEKTVKSPGYMIDRSNFNKSLMKEAGKLGCEIKTGHRAVPIGREAGKWKVRVENKYTSRIMVKSCEMLILAGGASFRGIVDLGLIEEKDYEKWRKQHVFGYQYKISSLHQGEELVVDFRPNPTREVVYHYIFPHHDDISNVGLLYNGKFVTKSFYDKLLREYLRKIGIRKFKFINRPAGNYIPGGGPLPRTYGDGILVVGDNAGFANPIFYGGVHPALSSGRIAGEVTVEAFRKNDLSEEFLKRYEDRWKEMPWGNPILLKGKEIHEKIRNGEKVKPEELEVYSKALDITKDYGW